MCRLPTRPPEPMQPCAIMAQLITLISLIFLLFLAKTFIKTAESQSEEYTTPIATYDEWYQSGMSSYTNGDWEDTIYYFEKALEEFKFYRKSLVECRLKCRNLTRSPGLPKDDSAVEEMKYFQGLFIKANCVRKCKLEKLGNRPQIINQDVTDKFLSRMPYSYLQFAYYKSFEYEKAVAGAYTYLQWNPDDEIMQNNLDYYRNLHGITEEHLVDVEEQLHHKYFLQGYGAYQNGDFPAVIKHMEESLREYWKADDECRALCEGKYENREFMDLYEAISNHYASVLFCKGQCEEWNSRMQGKYVENYLANHFHFLQFAYYKERKVEKAVEAAATFLVLVPSDSTMNSNMEFYEEEEGANKYSIQPMEEVVEYQKRKDMEMKMLQFAKMKFWGEEDQEYLEETYIDSTKEMTYTEEAEPINPDEVRLRINSAIEKRLNSVIENQLGQSWADLNINDRAEYMTKPEEVWDDEGINDDAELGIVEHFPEGNDGKPVEVWPEAEDFLDGEEEEDFMREYSPEPGVLYSDKTEEDVEDGDAEEEDAKDEWNNGKPVEVWPDTDDFLDGEEEEDLMREYSPEPGVVYNDKTEEDVIGGDVKDEASILRGSPEDVPVKKVNNEGSLNDNSLQSGEETAKKQSNSEKEIYSDPNLGYNINDNNVNLPDGKDKVAPENPTVTDTESKTVKKEKVEFTKDGLTKRKNRRPLSKGLNKTSQESGADFSLSKNNTEEVVSVSALERLKIVAREQDLFPSGPPRFGPSIHGKKEVEVDGPGEVPAYEPSLDGIKLYRNAAMLNGTGRMAADNIATQMECDNLLKLMEIESKYGDGYNGKVYPHTKFESFEGMTVGVAVNAGRAGRVPLILPATYMHLAEKSRIFMKKYFNLKKELFFSYTHLVCRTAEPDSTPSRNDPSHPIHADNCQIDERGICHKTSTSFTWRDWSAVLYLNDNFVGGDFVFAHPNFTIQSIVRPKCGRLVGFSAGVENLHGVKGVISGKRCALALWFTEDPRYQEGEFNVAMETFRDTWEEQEATRRSRETARTEL